MTNRDCLRGLTQGAIAGALVYCAAVLLVRALLP
jgi:hypothetical protein